MIEFLHGFSQIKVGVWFHLVLTFDMSRTSPTTMYINDNQATYHRKKTYNLWKEPYSGVINMNVGTTNVENGTTGDTYANHSTKFTIDDLIFWSEIKPREFIRDLYKTNGYGGG